MEQIEAPGSSETSFSYQIARLHILRGGNLVRRFWAVGVNFVLGCTCKCEGATWHSGTGALCGVHHPNVLWSCKVCVLEGEGTRKNVVILYIDVFFCVGDDVTMGDPLMCVSPARYSAAQNLVACTAFSLALHFLCLLASFLYFLLSHCPCFLLLFLFLNFRAFTFSFIRFHLYLSYLLSFFAFQYFCFPVLS